VIVGPSIINRNGCFFEGRQTQNSEDNIELGDGGDMTSVVWYFMGWLFFFEEPGIAIFMSCTHHPQMVGLLLGSPHHIYIYIHT